MNIKITLEENGEEQRSVEMVQPADIANIAGAYIQDGLMVAEMEQKLARVIITFDNSDNNLENLENNLSN